ncbi:MAG: Uma2 family endonuclease [Woronichinia naegeliana WA131]|jgi:Uma2 family endonuclease|uniref:Uma2 family endonuclease n=1 Tax=Woronichinia naegeliana WA131 TaxID=2824559 RepID=A0A977L343_9CYAN|nr:MAG: Uma2 family endonuclease [Woronichinia naegeliana WA131]
MVIATTKSGNIPLLENGDRLSRSEFERRYQAMPNHQKAELIAGIVYVASPLRITQHGNPHARIMTWLGSYWAATPGVELGDNSTVQLDQYNEPQPDALLRIQTGGQSTVNNDGYVEGAPELIVEIAASTVSLDLHQKLEVYQLHQVQEYLVWRVEDEQLDWFQLKQGKYLKLQPDTEGILYSQMFPGLWLDQNALLTGNLAKVLRVLQKGLASGEHQSFVEKLNSSKL